MLSWCKCNSANQYPSPSLIPPCALLYQYICREYFLDMLCEESGDFVLEECSQGAVSLWQRHRKEWQSFPITLALLRRTYSGDTVGVKRRRE
jgi:hypothetical protein